MATKPCGSVFLQLVPAVEYDIGKHPSVSINKDGIVVEVHNSEGLKNGLWYSLGQVSGGKIDWWSSSRAGINCYDYGYYPHVSVNSEGVVVEVHQSQFFRRVWYHVGKVNTQAKEITWGGSHEYEKGVTPAAALRDDGTIIAVHETSNPFSHDLYYLVGTVDATNKTINWGPPQRYGEGKFPSVAFNRDGVVVEMHKSQVRDRLWYRVGILSENIIAWGSSQMYETGIDPCIAINVSDQVIEVHKSEGLLRNLWHNIGKVDTGSKTITWSEETSLKYDRGITPAIAINDSGGVVEVHETDHQFKNALWYHTGVLKTALVE